MLKVSTTQSKLLSLNGSLSTLPAGQPEEYMLYSTQSNSWLQVGLNHDTIILIDCNARKMLFCLLLYDK